MNHFQYLERTNIKRLWKRYVVALCILVVLIVSAQIILQMNIKNQESDARTINLSGRQRMLSQFITKHAYIIFTSENKDEIKTSANSIQAAKNDFEKVHNGLLDGDDALELSTKNSEEIIRLFNSIETDYQHIIRVSQKISTMAVSNNFTKNELHEQIEVLKISGDKFLQGMDKVVYQYDLELKQKIKQVKVLEISLLVFILAILAVEIIFIFYPSFKRLAAGYTEIENNQKNLLKLFNILPASVVVSEDLLEVRYMNQQIEDLLHVQASDANLYLSDLLEKIHLDSTDIISEIKNKERLDNIELILHDPQNQSRIFLMSSNKIDIWSKPSILINFVDITKNRNMEKQARYDELTGLLNRGTGMLVLNETLEQSRKEQKNFILCFIDINKLKHTNDKYGHDEGDWYIKNVTKTITSILPVDECTVRYGGDEIIFSLLGYDLDYVESMMEHMQSKLNLLTKQYNKPYSLSISFGIYESTWDAAGDTLKKIITKADKVMYEQKKKYHQGSEEIK